MVTVYFVLEVSKSCAKKWRMFVRLSVDGDCSDIDASPVPGYVGLYVVKQDFPARSNVCMVQIGKTNGTSGKCVMDKSNYIADVSQDCVAYMQWGQSADSPLLKLLPHPHHVAVHVAIEELEEEEQKHSGCAARNGVVLLTAVRLYCTDTEMDYALPHFDEDGFQWDQYEGGSLMYNKQYINTPEDFVLWAERDGFEKLMAENTEEKYDEELILHPVFRYQLNLHSQVTIPSPPAPQRPVHEISGPHRLMRGLFMRKTAARRLRSTSPSLESCSQAEGDNNRKEKVINEALSNKSSEKSKQKDEHQEEYLAEFNLEHIENAIMNCEFEENAIEKSADLDVDRESHKNDDRAAQEENPEHNDKVENAATENHTSGNTQKPMSKSAARRRRKSRAINARHSQCKYDKAKGDTVAMNTANVIHGNGASGASKGDDRSGHRQREHSTPTKSERNKAGRTAQTTSTRKMNRKRRRGGKCAAEKPGETLFLIPAEAPLCSQPLYTPSKSRPAGSTAAHASPSAKANHRSHSADSRPKEKTKPVFGPKVYHPTTKYGSWLDDVTTPEEKKAFIDRMKIRIQDQLGYVPDYSKEESLAMISEMEGWGCTGTDLMRKWVSEDTEQSLKEDAQRKAQSKDEKKKQSGAKMKPSCSQAQKIPTKSNSDVSVKEKSLYCSNKKTSNKSQTEVLNKDINPPCEVMHIAEGTPAKMTEHISSANSVGLVSKGVEQLGTVSNIWSANASALMQHQTNPHTPLPPASDAHSLKSILRNPLPPRNTTYPLTSFNITSSQLWPPQISSTVYERRPSAQAPRDGMVIVNIEDDVPASEQSLLGVPPTAQTQNSDVSFFQKCKNFFAGCLRFRK